ncbi:MAG: response regulator transcription factor [Nitrospiraceae bacterium]|jgi:DNA-binding NarL/FixJ family response regulator|nr:response regulator transcription factor [Nitrospiraceae bacterium]OQW67768.1 MAG: DNA-binding response regulator [Nitrospira sp. ST-bin5]
MKKPTVILADDHTLVLEGFRRLLETHCELLATVGDGQALLKAAAQHRPDIVILDISMPVMNGIEAARTLKSKFPSMRLVFVTMHADPAYVRAAFQAGACGYLLKQSLGAELTQALHTVLRGQSYVTPLIAKDVVDGALSHDQPPLVELTARQQEVLQLIVDGHSAKDIATKLNISHRTVEFHKAQLMQQLDLHSTVELIKFALTNGLARLS